MIEQRIPQPSCTDTDHIIERAEREIARLKAARPALEGRISKAEHILTVQLSVRNGSRPIRVRVHADGTKSYTVRSNSKLRKVYAVNPAGWTCECKWQQNGHSACSHALAAYILERAYRSPEYGTCSGCSHRVPNRDLFEVLDSLTFFEGDMVCGDCRSDTASEVS